MRGVHPLSRRFLLVAAAVSALVLSSCGSGEGSEDDIYGLDSPESTASTSESSGTNADSGIDTGNADNTDNTDDNQDSADFGTGTNPEAGQESAGSGTGQATDPVGDFTDCMATAGVEIPELARDESGLISIGQLLGAVDVMNPSTQLALFGCQSSFDAATGGRLFQLLANPALQEALVSFSDCVRDGGFDVPDLDVITALTRAASAGTDGSPTELLAATLNLDPSDPEVQAAVEACGTEIQQQLVELGLF